MTLAPLFFAKRGHVPCRIMHSHSTRVIHKIFYPVHWFHKLFINRLATVKIACSDDAGKWMFPGEYLLIKNAITIPNYQFDPKARLSVRQSLGMSNDTLVIGHIGRFFPAKNHSFIINVFEEILKSGKKAVLLLVGDGGQELSVRHLVSEKGLENHVMFLGAQTDVNKYLSAFDVFLFPSIYEGFGIALLEAQTNGVPIFCSTNITKESTITPCVYRLHLNAGPKYWAEKILSADLKRNDYSHFIIDAGFDIQKEANKLQHFYLTQASNRSYLP